MSTYRQHYKTVSAPKVWTPLNLLGVFLIVLFFALAPYLDEEPPADTGSAGGHAPAHVIPPHEGSK
jgi:hypothetical protein